MSSAFHVANSENVDFSRNVWKTTPASGRAGVLIDRSTTSKVVTDGNVTLKQQQTTRLVRP